MVEHVSRDEFGRLVTVARAWWYAEGRLFVHSASPHRADPIPTNAVLSYWDGVPVDSPPMPFEGLPLAQRRKIISLSQSRSTVPRALTLEAAIHAEEAAEAASKNWALRHFPITVYQWRRLKSVLLTLRIIRALNVAQKLADDEQPLTVLAILRAKEIALAHHPTPAVREAYERYKVAMKD